jgi:hypothetical protein
MMHVSWTTLREQIFAKLRRPYRSDADMNEVGHGQTYLTYIKNMTLKFQKGIFTCGKNCNKSTS